MKKIRDRDVRSQDGDVDASARSGIDFALLPGAFLDMTSYATKKINDWDFLSCQVLYGPPLVLLCRHKIEIQGLSSSPFKQIFHTHLHVWLYCRQNCKQVRV